LCVFFFQAEDGIRDYKVTGVQTCALPIFVGAIFLLGATAAYLAGFGGVGLVLGTIVAALALLAASTGLCVGCEMYRIAAKTRGVRTRRIETVDLAELGAASVSGEIVVEFTHPLC